MYIMYTSKKIHCKKKYYLNDIYFDLDLHIYIIPMGAIGND